MTDEAGGGRIRRQIERMAEAELGNPPGLDPALAQALALLAIARTLDDLWTLIEEVRQEIAELADHCEKLGHEGGHDD